MGNSGGSSVGRRCECVPRSIFTVCNEVAKVMFLQVCVCPQEGGYPSMPCRWYPSIPCSRSLGGGGVCYPSMPCRWYPSMLFNRSPVGAAPGGLLWGGGGVGLLPGGLLQGWGGACSRGDGDDRRLLLRTVRILLECILVRVIIYCSKHIM